MWEGGKNNFYTRGHNLNIAFVLEQLTAETTESDPMSVLFVKIHSNFSKIFVVPQQKLMRNGVLVVFGNPWSIFRSKPRDKNGVEVTLQRQKRSDGCGMDEKE